MSAIWRHYQLNDSWDITWTICSTIGLIILIIILFAFCKTLQHFHCIPESFSNAGYQRKLKSKHIKTYSTLSVIFAAISAIIIFTIFPVCSQWSCSENLLGNIYTILWWSSYCLSRLFLYLIFIKRLFNPLYVRIYCYPRYIEYSLWVLLIMETITIVAWNVTSGFTLATIQYPQSVDVICLAVYGITECTLSTSLTILFFRPICNKNAVSTAAYKSLVGKYAAISALQMIIAVSAQLANLMAYYISVTGSGVSVETLRVYGDIKSIVQMLDCLLLIICIYFGFARQETVCTFKLWQPSKLIVIL